MRGSETGIFLGCPDERRTEHSLGLLCVSKTEMYPTCPRDVDDPLATGKHRCIPNSMHMRCHLKRRTAQ